MNVYPLRLPYFRTVLLGAVSSSPFHIESLMFL